MTKWFSILLAAGMAVRATLAQPAPPAPPAGAAPVTEPAPAVPAATAAPNPAATAPTSGPRIEFGQALHDFGRLEPGQIARHDFVFTNTGNARLEILEVRPGCGCTTAGTWDRVVEPGQTGKIPIQFNSGTFSGPVSKSVAITCNDPLRSSLYLQLKATVWAALAVSPASVYFSVSSETPSSETKVVRIVNNEDQPVRLESPVTTNASFRAEVKTVREGKEFELHVSAVPPFTGNYTTSPIEIRTSSAKVPVVKVQASASILPAVSVVPTFLSLQSTPAARPSVTVRNTGTNSLTLSNATVNIPGATVEIHEMQPGRVFRLSLALPADFKIEPGKRFELSVASSHPAYPKLTVPLIAPSRPSPAAIATPPTARVPAGNSGIPPLLARPPEEPVTLSAPAGVSNRPSPPLPKSR